MSQVKVKVTRMYFDGEKRIKEGAVLFVDEKQVIASCHEVINGKVSKADLKKESEKKALPGQGPKPKPKAPKEEELEEKTESEDPSSEDTPI